MLIRFGRTPGKRLFGLRVVGRTPVPGLVREALKLLPGLIVGLALAALHFAGPQAYGVLRPGRRPALCRCGVLPMAAVVFWLYVLPFLRWRGAARYDRWLGLTVARG